MTADAASRPLPRVPGLSLVQGKAVIARFDGGRLSSEGGLLVLREVERRLGLADRLAACLKDRRAPEKVVHRLAEIMRFRMLMIAAGYPEYDIKAYGVKEDVGLPEDAGTVFVR